MSRAAIVAWGLGVCTGRRKSQAKTLAELAAAAVTTTRARLANLGRAMAGTARCKHRIKRAARFVAKRRVTVADGMAGVIQRLTRRREPLVVSLDWVEVRNFHTLVAAAAAGGRSIPLLWASYPEWELHKSQNNLEEGLIRLLRSLVSDRVRIILLADRGFGRAELARTLSGLVNVSFVIRIKPQVVVRHPRFSGKLIDYPVRKGMRRVLRGAWFRSTDPVDVNVVVRWKRGLPAGRDEPWFLITDLGKRPAVRLTELYGRRMGIEEFFRDCKSVRNGLALRHTQLTRADRFDRFVLILVRAYLLLTGLGLRAMAGGRAGIGRAGTGGRCAARRWSGGPCWADTAFPRPPPLPPSSRQRSPPRKSGDRSEDRPGYRPEASARTALAISEIRAIHFAARAQIDYVRPGRERDEIPRRIPP